MPGALTNQPPVPATAPLTQPATGTTAAPGKPAKPGELQGKLESAGITAPLNPVGQPISTSKNATINYEVDKTIRYTKQAMGNIRRLSAAMVINHRQVTGKDGQPTSKPIPDAEMKQINELVREAMGFNKERGDTISVANAPFTAVDKSESEMPLWKDPENISYAKDIAKYLIIAAIIAFLYFKIIQPSLKTMFEPPAKSEKESTEEGGLFGGAGGLPGEGEEEGATEVRIDHYAIKIQKARDAAEADPNAVANIIKDWMNPSGS